MGGLRPSLFIMTLLQAVNRIIPALGEYPVDSIETSNPTVGIVLHAIENARHDLLLKGWWFNRFETTLYPNSAGVYKAPHGTIEWVPKNVPAILLGDKFINPEDTSDKFPRVTRLEGTITLDVSFDDLPASFKLWVVYKGMVDAYLNDIGLEEVVGQWQREAFNAENLVMMQHLRFMQYSTRKGGAARKMRKHMGR